MSSGWSNPQISYWHAGAPAMLATDPLPARSQVVVIGGGLLGSCTAFWLARAGAQVTLIEQGAPAFGATGRNGGFMVVGTTESYPATIERLGHDAARTIMQITIDSRQLLRAIHAEEQLDCQYREAGRVNLELNAEEREGHARSVAALRADGFDAEQIDRAQLQELIATPLAPEIVGAIYSREDGLLHSAQFIHGMVAAARRHGARLCAATVGAIRQEGGGVRVETNQGSVSADSVVLAVNAWSDQLVPELRGVITPVRGQILNYAPLPQVFRCGVGGSVTPTGEYWHQTPDGSIVLGGCRAIAPDGEVGLLQDGTTPEVQAALEGVFPRLFPQLSGLKVERRWSGPMAFTHDYTPIADRVPGLDRAWFVGGFCGHGMPFGLRLGQLLAEAATTNVKPATMAPLRLDRPTLSKRSE
jgi:gamma-glutamylputrescine oxidase